MNSNQFKINRAPVMVLWGTVVAEQLGYDHDTALTLGKTVAGLNAQSKGQRLGIYEPDEEQEAEAGREKEPAPGELTYVVLLGRSVPATQTKDGLRALSKDKPVDPRSVKRYLDQKFGENLESARSAMQELAGSMSQEDFRKAYSLWRVSSLRSEGKRGWCAGDPDLEKIMAQSMVILLISCSSANPDKWARRNCTSDFLSFGWLALAAWRYQLFPQEGDRITGESPGYDPISTCVPNHATALNCRQTLRDQLVNIYYDLEPDDASFTTVSVPGLGGYSIVAISNRSNSLHRTYIPGKQGGQLCEVTVPFAQSYRYSRYDGWLVEYRLYYETTHWVYGIDEGPDGQPWYRVTDELQPIDYFVPAPQLRPIPDEELALISPDVPASQKRIEVNLALQTLQAFENDRLVLETKVSTGVPRSRPTDNGIPTETPKGSFAIYSRCRLNMGDGRLMGATSISTPTNWSAYRGRCSSTAWIPVTPCTAPTGITTSVTR
jgi:hypothetical protein